MLLALEGIAGAGKSTVRDRLLSTAAAQGPGMGGHVGQFSWLSLEATRTIIALRSGLATTSDQAVAAARHDLELHTRHNLTPALKRGSVIADRLTLSTACLLALLHQRPVDHYVHQLSQGRAPRAELTVLLTTDPSLCQARLAQRPTPHRFGEDPATTAQLTQTFDQAATVWTQETGLPVLRHPCATAADLDVVTATCLDRLRATAPCPART